MGDRVLVAVLAAEKEASAALHLQMDLAWLLRELWDIVVKYAVPSRYWDDAYFTVPYRPSFEKWVAVTLPPSKSAWRQALLVPHDSCGDMCGTVRFSVCDSAFNDGEGVKIWTKSPIWESHDPYYGSVVLKLGTTALSTTYDHHLGYSTQCGLYGVIPCLASELIYIELTRYHQLLYMRFHFSGNRCSRFLLYARTPVSSIPTIELLMWRRENIDLSKWTIGITSTHNNLAAKTKSRWRTAIRRVITSSAT